MCYLAFGLGFLLCFVALALVGLLLDRAQGTKTTSGPALPPSRYAGLTDIDELSNEYLHDLEGMMQHLFSKGERKR